MDEQGRWISAGAEKGPIAPSADADSLFICLERIVANVVAPCADDVDQQSRFPQESIAALKDAQLLAAAVPAALGGLGCSIPILSRICTSLAHGCASTAMIVAMHYGQVYMLARHAGTSDYFRGYLQTVARRQLLVASATSEVGNRDIGTSKAAVVRTHDRFRLEKRCSVLSYAEHADSILATARRTSDAAPGDQSFVLLSKGDYELRDIGMWNALGMRGTCSPPAVLRGNGSIEQIVPAPYREVAERSMIPISNVLWSSVWLGIAEAAFAIARTRTQLADLDSGQIATPGSRRLIRAAAALQLMRNNIDSTARECEQLGSLSSPTTEDDLIGQILRTNNLKLSTSEMVWQVCHECLAVCGVAGYVNLGRFSLGRHLRDALSAVLMLPNDRIETTNAALLLLHSGSP